MSSELFVRPHLCASESAVEMRISLAALRQLSSYQEFCGALARELEEVYGQPAATNSSSPLVHYSTAAEPQQFSSALDETTFDRLKKYDESTELARLLGEEHAATVAQHEELESQRDPEKKKSRQERHEERDRLANIANTMKQWKLKEHEAACLKQKLANVFDMYAIRVTVP